MLESFKFEPRRVKERKEKQEEIKNKKKEAKTKKLEHLLQQTRIESNLDLTGTNFSSLGNIKRIIGALYLSSDTKITYIDPKIQIRAIVVDNQLVSKKNFNLHQEQKHIKGFNESFKFEPRRIQQRNKEREEALKQLGIVKQGKHFYKDGLIIMHAIDFSDFDNRSKYFFVDQSLLGNLMSIMKYKRNRIGIFYAEMNDLVKININTVTKITDIEQTKISFIKEKLNESFSFQPRRIEDRERQKKERRDKLWEKFEETFGNLEELTSYVNNSLDNYVKQGWTITVDFSKEEVHNSGYYIQVRYKESIMNKGYRAVCNIESDNNCYYYIWDSVTRKGSPVCCKIYRKEQIIKILVKQIKELNKFLDTKNLQEAGSSNKKLYVLKPIKDNMFLRKIKELYPEGTNISYKETYDGYLFNRYDQELIRLLILHNQEYKLLSEEELIENTIVIQDKLLLTKKGFAILSKNKEYFDKYIVLPVIKDFFVSQYQSKYTFIKDYDIYKDRETTESINYTIGIKISSISKIEDEDRIIEEIKRRCELLMKRQDLIFHKV